ncbi:ABC transporter permease subunit [Burkholderia sp. Ac-20365]|uniref:ABC transporter permease n=1 Tax=Burkholderia sp. Ac-20365 TaxID=2703897 RepID=UPI00197BF369|nr:ABC transporter permease subunit [Burkholderia sp. Ac-20365]MBN3765406.1 ABC transporter permease subunit [Burkholderia sp. Ac-20365]
MDLFSFTLNRTANASAWRVLPNRWDFVAFPLIICLIAMAVVGFHETMAPISTLQSEPISLDPGKLPEYALRTTLRMLAAMVASLAFTLVYGTLAAKSRRAGQVLVPILDILQSVPVLGYISFTVTFFLALFPSRVLGAELAAIFAIFTSQAWNMTFSFYQSLRTVPRDLDEVSKGFHLTSWQRFWKLEVPFSMPGLIWNMMMSMSGGWFFVVASEAITVGNHTITLPGVGSYLSQAINERNLHAIGWVILTMTVVILAYDQFLFRPLVAWSDKFRMENTSSGDAPESWLLDLIRRTRLIHRLLVPIGWMFAKAARVPIRWPSVGPVKFSKPAVLKQSRAGDIVWAVIVVLVTAFVVYRVVAYVRTGVTLDEVGHVFVLGLITLLRVTLLIALASVVWLPVGVLIGLRPALAEKVQPVAQFLAAFPANLLFPVFVIVIVKFNLNPDIWLSPLIVLGTQWYILFNVIAGASAYPNDYKEAAKNFRIRGWQWWRQAMLPGVFPYYVTGAITASGGAWNASIVAEAVQWGDTRLAAHGLGAYIAQYTAAGDYPKIILGIAVMSLFVSLFNRVLWRPLYAYAESRLRLD